VDRGLINCRSEHKLHVAQDKEDLVGCKCTGSQILFCLRYAPRPGTAYLQTSVLLLDVWNYSVQVLDSDSLVGIAMRFGLDGLDFEASSGRVYSGPSLLYNGHRVSLPGINFCVVYCFILLCCVLF
jgi:hypothetical protein